MEAKERFVPVDAEEFFRTIRRDELEILEQLIPLEIYAVDTHGELIVDGQGIPIVEGYSPESKISIPPTNRFYATVDGKNGTLPDSIINGYRDVFDIDVYLSNGLAELYTYNDPSYSGAVWVFEDDNYLGIYGIRSSIANTINKKRGVATAILRYIIAGTDKHIVVPWPLEGMLPILRKYGFKEYNTTDMDPIRKFLQPYTNTSNYWLLES